MSKRQTAGEIDDEAADWAVRVDGREDAAEQDPQLSAWLAGDPRRHGAFLRAQAALSFLDRGRALAGAEPPPIARGFRPSRRAVLTAGGSGAVAAGLAVGLFAATAGKRYETGLGEIRSVPLQDGSLIAINTRSILEVALRPRLRQVHLREGEAWFEVAKDPQRPFVVDAGAVRIRAVGTAFSVRRLEEGADVMVTEGLVEAWLADAPEQTARLPAGSKIITRGDRLGAVIQAPGDIERSLSWRSGQIALDGQTLAEAAAEFNRYNTRQIVIEDPDLARERFVGLFRTNEPESFAAAVAATLGARVIRDPEAIRLDGRV